MAIEYEGYLKDTNDDDILDWNNNAYKLNQVKNWLNSFLDNQTIIALIHTKIKEGYNHSIPINFCQIINGGSARVLKGNSSEGWKKGTLKFKFVLEFIPDEPEISEYQSPLDEIRNHPSFPNSSS